MEDNVSVWRMVWISTRVVKRAPQIRRDATDFRPNCSRGPVFVPRPARRPLPLLGPAKTPRRLLRCFFPRSPSSSFTLRSKLTTSLGKEFLCGRNWTFYWNGNRSSTPGPGSATQPDDPGISAEEVDLEFTFSLLSRFAIPLSGFLGSPCCSSGLIFPFSPV